MTDDVTSTFHVERKPFNGAWGITGDAPHPHQPGDNAQTMPRDVWVAFVAYLNEREGGLPKEERNFYRLVRWDVTRKKVIVNV